MALFDSLATRCCSTGTCNLLLVIHPVSSQDFDPSFCYEIPERDFPEAEKTLEEITARFPRRAKEWVPGNFALRLIRLCDGCGKSEEIVSFDIPPGKTDPLQGEILVTLDTRGFVRRGELWSVE